MYYDGDELAVDGMFDLYTDGVAVSRIQRTLSLGMLGVQKQRKIVPTRWSITAVDDTLSKRLLRSVRNYPPIDKYQVYTYQYLDNVYEVLLSPRNWEYESIEAWFPGTAWNENGTVPAIMGDHEPYEGRTTYASIGGCYYSCRLAAAEALERVQRQACGPSSSGSTTRLHPSRRRLERQGKRARSPQDKTSNLRHLPSSATLRLHQFHNPAKNLDCE